MAVTLEAIAAIMDAKLTAQLAPFVERIDGDPSNVIGLSLPLLRSMLTRLGVAWPSLW